MFVCRRRRRTTHLGYFRFLFSFLWNPKNDHSCLCFS